MLIALLKDFLPTFMYRARLRIIIFYRPPLTKYSRYSCFRHNKKIFSNILIIMNLLYDSLPRIYFYNNSDVLYSNSKVSEIINFCFFKKTIRKKKHYIHEKSHTITKILIRKMLHLLRYKFGIYFCLPTFVPP